MLTLIALAALAATAGPHLLTTEDVDQDGKPDKIYWSQRIHPVANVSDIGFVTWDVEIYVKSNGEMNLAGNFTDIEQLDKFWMTDKPTSKRKLIFKVLAHNITRYFGISRMLKLFEIPEETFA